MKRIILGNNTANAQHNFSPDNKQKYILNIILTDDILKNIVNLKKGKIKMKIKRIEKNNVICAVIESNDIVITDVQSALDLLMTANYETETKNIVIDKNLITEDFFVLSSGLAGEILQKYINYGGRIAIYGDYSLYTSKPLHDFIYESNQGRDVFFTATEEDAINALAQ